MPRSREVKEDKEVNVASVVNVDNAVIEVIEVVNAVIDVVEEVAVEAEVEVLQTTSEEEEIQTKMLMVSPLSRKTMLQEKEETADVVDSREVPPEVSTEAEVRSVKEAEVEWPKKTKAREKKDQPLPRTMSDFFR